MESARDAVQAISQGRLDALPQWPEDDTDMRHRQWVNPDRILRAWADGC